jgi:hypothetical protein
MATDELWKLTDAVRFESLDGHHDRVVRIIVFLSVPVTGLKLVV